MNIPQQSMKLKRIIGFTSSGRNSFAYQPNTGNLIYIAGCVIVIVDPQQNHQQHLYTGSKQAITTLAISDDGRFLAAANCGDQATVCIWDLSNMLLIAKLEESTLEVSCLCFSGNNKILVSAGYRTNNSYVLNIWNWRQQSLVVSHKITTKVRSISFNWNSTYFVTVGDAYVKYWYLNYGNDVDQNQDLCPVTFGGSRSAVLGEQKANSFCGVKCGHGNLSESTFCITKSGLLCEINERRLLHKWVDLRTPSANSLDVGEDLIVVGCANGVIRCFNPTELRFLRNLPRPHLLGLDPASVNRNIPTQGASSLYPSVINVCLNESLNTIACSHNDRSIYIWDMTGADEKIVKSYSALYHSSCIWGIDVYPSSMSSANHFLPVGSFITCSSDDTLRIWNPDMYSEQQSHLMDRNAANNIPFCINESLKIIFTDSTCKYLCDLENSNNSKADENYDSNEGLRCLRISPNGRQLAVGSRSGAIRIFDFELDIEIKNIAAHDAEVLCLEYSDSNKFDGYCYLASSSRDKLIHIFDANDNYTFLQTIDDHLSSITALRFVNNRARDCLQLISCGADSRIIFRNGVKVEGKLDFMPDQHIEGKNTFYDMEVDSESSCLITACQDRMIRLFNVAQVKYQSGFKGSLSKEGTIIKIALDPSCTFLATSSTDKSINIYDYQRGECIASISEGLSDLVTDMKFSPDGRHLIACSGDGCIFVWKSPPEIVNAIGNNQGVGQISLSSCPLGSINKTRRLDMTKVVDQKEPPRKAPPRLKQLPDWEAQQNLIDARVADLKNTNKKYPSNETLYDDSTLMNKPYQVQNLQFSEISRNDNDDTEADQARALMSHSTQVINEISADEIVDSSPRVASSKTNERMRQNSKLANAFKSRENLDQISLREKFVAQGLMINRDSKKDGANKNNKSSLSGQFNTKQSLDGGEFEATHQQENYMHSSEDELFANGDDRAKTNLTVRPTTPPKPSLHRQTRRSSLSQSNQQLPDQSPLAHSELYNREGAPKTAAQRLNNNRVAYTMRPSKSECNLELFEDKDDGDMAMKGEKFNRKKIDLSKLHPSEVPLNQEFCQYLVDELQALSKYAIKLHQRLLVSGENYSSLSNLMASGIQNSRDILSIMQTPENHNQQYKLNTDLSPVSSIMSHRNKLTKQSASSSSHDKPQVNQLSSTLGSRRSQEETTKSNVNSYERSKLNLDQVLEAYSDRLFKLVKERVVETSGNTGA